MELYLFRHGKTKYNIRGEFTGWYDSHLDEEGIKNAYSVREYFIKNEISIDYVYSSDLSRAINTAKIAFPNKKIIMDPRIRERDYGYLKKLSKKKYEKKHPMIYELYHRSSIISPPAGESFDIMIPRVKSFLEEIRKKHNDKNVAVSAHGNSIRVMMMLLEDYDLYTIEHLEIKFGKVYHYTI